MTISRRILDTLNKKNLSQKALAQHTNVSESAISDWKKKGTNPASDNLSAIADFLEVSIEYLLTGTEKETSPPTALAVDELELLTYYRQLPEREQGKLLGRMEVIASEQSSADAPADEEPRRTIKQVIRQIDLYQLPVSAGRGTPLDSDYKDVIDIPLTAASKKADYALNVSGDSMTPTYKDDDIILVKEQSDIEIGEIGIFIVNGEGFVKKLGDDRLISLNEAYADIMLDSCDNISCRGKVIGKL